MSVDWDVVPVKLPFLVSSRLAEAVIESVVNAVDVRTANLVDVTTMVVEIMEETGEDSGPPAVV